MTSVIFRKQSKTYLVTLLQGDEHDEIVIQEYEPLEKAYLRKHVFKVNKFVHKIRDTKAELEKYLNLYLKTFCP